MGYKITDPTPKRYFVLGCPESATSFIAKALQDQGVEMGYKGKNEWCMEDPTVVAANNSSLNWYDRDLLNPPFLNNGTRTNPTHHIHFNPYLIEWYRALDLPLAGAKDPRFAFTFHTLAPELNNDDYLIAVFRKPSKIAKGWAKRLNRRIDQQLLNLIWHYQQSTIDQIHAFLKAYGGMPDAI
jgi:hypothetical protein